MARRRAVVFRNLLPRLDALYLAAFVGSAGSPVAIRVVYVPKPTSRDFSQREKALGIVGC